MNRRWIVALTVLLAASVFGAGALMYAWRTQEREANAGAGASNHLVRPHSPVIGPQRARVTIVEFFDPACETCRAFYPVVKEIISRFPNEVRLLVRYTPLHEGSDEAVRILAAARIQNVFEPVLERMLMAQPVWAKHGAPRLSVAWEAAAAAGLDVTRARLDSARKEIDEVLKQDIADGRTANVRATPTFFVNGKPLLVFGAQQLYELVRSEVETARRSGT